MYIKHAALLLLCSLLILTQAGAQEKYYTKQGSVSFDATGGPEKIQASSHAGICILDTKTGALQFAVLMKGFEFEKALMQEHFNENYVESDKFPRAEFKGSIADNAHMSWSKNGTYDVQVKGVLTLHGVSKDVSAPGKLIIANGGIQAISDLSVLFSDFRIAIPSIVKDKLADHATVHIDCSLTPLKM